MPRVSDIALTINAYYYSHQWMFITDTVDAIYRPNNWLPEALLDQLAEVVGNLSRVRSKYAILLTKAEFVGRLPTSRRHIAQDCTGHLAARSLCANPC